MKLIHKNPYRILGLPVSASTRDITKKVSELEMYLGIGKPVSCDTDFPFLAPVERSLDMVRHASNQIESDEGRFKNSLFWFWCNNATDELALEVLMEGNTSSAIRLLEKQVSNGHSLIKSFSSAKNLSLLYLAMADNGESFSFNEFANGLFWAGKTMDDDLLSAYAKQITDKHFKYNSDTIQDAFINEVVKTITPLVDVAGGISLSKLIPSFSTFPEETKHRVAKKFVSDHFQKIEDAIALAEKERKDNPGKANNTAKILINSSSSSIKAIFDAFGPDDYSYQNVANRLAEEIENCSTDYYNYHINNEEGVDPGDDSLKLSRYASKLATSLNIKERIEKGIAVTEKWIDSRHEREKSKKVKPSIDYIIKQINSLPKFADLSKSQYWKLLQYAEKLINDCKPHLNRIKFELGSNDKTYLEFSSVVVNNAMGLCISYANETKKSSEVTKIFKSMFNFAMDGETRDRFNRNNEIFNKNAKVELYIDPIVRTLDSIPNMDEIRHTNSGRLIELANNLIDSTDEHLISLNSVDRKLYLDLSSAIANTGLSLCIEYANRTGGVVRAMILMRKIEKLDMNPSLRANFIKNKEILSSNRNTKISNNIDRFCFIATMVYGDCNAPQVLVLRKYRDEVLSKSYTGRLFIKLYYKLSPKFVKYFGRFKTVHMMSKLVLDRIVQRLM